MKGELKLFDILLVSETELLKEDDICQRRVTSFTRPTTGLSSLGSPTEQRTIIAGVAQIDRGELKNRQQRTAIAYVVGVGIPKATPIEMSREIDGVGVHGFILMKVARLPDGFVEFVVAGRVIYLYERPYPLPSSPNSPLRTRVSLSQPHRIMCMDMRPLTKEQLVHIHSHCSGIDGRLPLDQAKLFIRDPWVARGRLEEDVARQEALRMSLTNHPFSLFKEKRPSGASPKVTLMLDLDEKETRMVISGPDSESKLSWRVGDELLFRCQRDGKCLTAVGRTKTVSLIIDRIDYLNTERLGSNGKFVERRSRVVLDASATKQSRELFSLLETTGQSIEGARCSIGPQAETIYSLAEAVEEGFFQFYNGTLFEEWRGSEVSKRISLYDKKLTTAGGLSLDNSQLSSLRSVAGVSGFSCISAPPGSGKTLLISALVTARNSPSLPPTSFAVTAATNTSVTAAMEAIAFNSPDLKICREFAKRAKFEANKLSLRDMSLTPYDYVEEGYSSDLDEAYRAMLQAKEQLDVPLELEHNVSVADSSALRKSFDIGRRRLVAFNDAERRLRDAFVNAYGPHAICTTPVLLSRRPYPVTHLVVDEAALMSPLEALAIYCRQPNLTHVTLLGDDKQMCPISDLPRSWKWDDVDQSPAYLLSTTGELPRAMGCRLMRSHGREETMAHPPPSTSIQKLTNMYRHHHSLVANWLVPIYGASLSDNRGYVELPPLSTTANTRLKMTAQDGCPCVLINLPYKELCPAEMDEKRKREKNSSEEDRKRLEQLRNWEQEMGKKKEKGGKRVPRVCEREVDLAIEIIEQLKVMGLEGEDVAIMCHHRSTKELLLIKLKGKGTVGGLRLPVDVSTVAAYQGKTAKAVIILTTSTASPSEMGRRSLDESMQMFVDKKFGLASNDRRACVALSRSLGFLFIIGDWQYLLQTSFWGEYGKLIHDTGAMVDESFQYISPPVTRPPNRIRY